VRLFVKVDPKAAPEKNRSQRWVSARRGSPRPLNQGNHCTYSEKPRYTNYGCENSHPSKPDKPRDEPQQNGSNGNPHCYPNYPSTQSQQHDGKNDAEGNFDDHEVRLYAKTQRVGRTSLPSAPRVSATRESLKLRTTGLHKLKSVPKRIIDKESPHARNTVVDTRFVTRSSAPSSMGPQVVNVERHVSFLGGTKVSFDS
jgi:hypothetical protein